AGQLGNAGRRLRPLEDVTRVDVRDARAERDLARDERERRTERQAVTRARAVDAAEALALERLRQVQRRLTPPRDGDETYGGLRCHPWGSIPNHARPRPLRARTFPGWMRPPGKPSRPPPPRRAPPPPPPPAP